MQENPQVQKKQIKGST